VNATDAVSAQQKNVDDHPPSINQGHVKKKQKTARREKNRRKEQGNDYFGSDDPLAARAESNNGTISPPYSREAAFSRRGFWDWSR
jgi:hypothetical protein